MKHESIEVLVIRNAKGEALTPTRWAGGVSQEVGWIGLDETVGYDGRRWFRGLTDEEWYSTPWITSTAGLCVWVSKGKKTWGEVCDEIMPTQDQTKRERKHLYKMRDVFEEEGYTYVALGLGRMQRGPWEVTNLRAHVTIAYAAAMSERQMDALRAALKKQVGEWCRLEPRLRPRNITRFRRWETQSRQDKPHDTRLSRQSTYRHIVGMEQAEVERMVAEDRIHTLDLDEDDEASLGEFVDRLYRRDRDRLREGQDRAAQLPVNNGTLIVYRTDEGLGEGSQELKDLLSYLADTVRFFAGASKRLDPLPGKARGKLMPPYVTEESRWHVTKQGAWLRSVDYEEV